MEVITCVPSVNRTQGKVKLSPESISIYTVSAKELFMYSFHRCRVYPVRISTIIHWKAGQRWVGMLFIVFLKIPLQQSAAGGFETLSCSYSEFFWNPKANTVERTKKNKKNKNNPNYMYIFYTSFCEVRKAEVGGRRRKAEARWSYGSCWQTEWCWKWSRLSTLTNNRRRAVKKRRKEQSKSKSPSPRVQVSAEQPRDRWTPNGQNIPDWRKCQVPYAVGWQLWSSSRAQEWGTASVCMATVKLSNTQIYKSKPFWFYSTCLRVRLFRSGRSLCPLRPNRWW